MSYTPPASDAVDFDLQPGYIAPAADAVDFDLGAAGPAPGSDPTGVLLATTDAATATIDGYHSAGSTGELQAATEPSSASATASHGTSAAISTETSASATITATSGQAYTLDLNASTEPASSAVEAQHGTIAAISATTQEPTTNGTATHGRAGQLTTSTGAAIIQAEGVRGVALEIAATTEGATAEIDAQMIVFCLSGAVQDENGLPMERTVRAHRLDDGALAAETVSSSTGIFDINVGFESGEFYVIALDTGPEGTDYQPPITNRVTSVLRYD